MLYDMSNRTFKYFKEKSVKTAFVLELNKLEEKNFKTTDEIKKANEELLKSGTEKANFLLKDNILEYTNYNKEELTRFLVRESDDLKIEEDKLRSLKSYNLSYKDMINILDENIEKENLEDEMVKNSKVYTKVNFEDDVFKIEATSEFYNSKMYNIEKDYFKDLVKKQFRPSITKAIEETVNDFKTEDKYRSIFQDLTKLKDIAYNNTNFNFTSNKIIEKLDENNDILNNKTLLRKFESFLNNTNIVESLSVDYYEEFILYFEKTVSLTDEKPLIPIYTNYNNQIDDKGNLILEEKNNKDFEKIIEKEKDNNNSFRKNQFYEKMVDGIMNLIPKENYTKNDLIKEKIDEIFLVEVTNKDTKEKEELIFSKEEMKDLIDIKTNDNELKKNDKIEKSDIKIFLIPDETKNNLANNIIEIIEKDENVRENIVEFLKKNTKEININDKNINKAKDFLSVINKMEKILEDYSFKIGEKDNKKFTLTFSENNYSNIYLDIEEKEISNSNFSNNNFKEKEGIEIHFSDEDFKEAFINELILEFKTHNQKGTNQEKLEEIKKLEDFDFSPIYYSNIKDNLVGNTRLKYSSENKMFSLKFEDEDKEFEILQSKENPSLKLALAFTDNSFREMFNKGIGDYNTIEKYKKEKLFDESKNIIENFSKNVEKETINDMNKDIKFHTLIGAISDFEKSNEKDKTVLDFIKTNLDEISDFRTGFYYNNSLKEKFLINNAENLGLQLNYFDNLMIEKDEINDFANTFFIENKNKLYEEIIDDYHNVKDKLVDKSSMNEEIINKNLKNEYLFGKGDVIDNKKQYINDYILLNLIRVDLSLDNVKDKLFRDFSIYTGNEFSSNDEKVFKKTFDKILENSEYEKYSHFKTKDIEEIENYKKSQKEIISKTPLENIENTKRKDIEDEKEKNNVNEIEM